MELNEVSTERLQLRQWRETDYPAFAQINADPEVMAFFPCTLSTQQSNALAARCTAQIDERGWGLWAVALKQGNKFIGFTGLNLCGNDLPFSPCTEIAWRLDRAFWGKGYATEAAEAVLEFAFTALKLQEVVSFTAAINWRSIAVMNRLNMHNTGQNFHHPAIPVNHPLAPHVLYRITAAQWRKTGK